MEYIVNFSMWKRLYESAGVPTYPNYPKSGINSSFSKFRYAAGEEVNEIPGYFPAAKLDIDRLESMLKELGWKPNPDPKSDEWGNNTFEEWKTVGIGWNNISSSLSEYQRSLWETAVVPNAKAISMVSPDGDSTLYANTWDSFDYWIDVSPHASGIRVSLCSGGKYKQCAANPMIFNQGTLSTGELLSAEIKRILGKS
jgi:hypothetical protein